MHGFHILEREEQPANVRQDVERLKQTVEVAGRAVIAEANKLLLRWPRTVPRRRASHPARGTRVLPRV